MSSSFATTLKSFFPIFEELGRSKAGRHVEEPKIAFLHSICLCVFFAEGILNTVSGLILIVIPAWSLTSFGVKDVHTQPIGIEMMRWFGSLVMLLGYIGLRAKVTKGNIEGLLYGDILYLIVFVQFIVRYGEWTWSAILGGGVVVLILATFRTVYLCMYSKWHPLPKASLPPLKKKRLFTMPANAEKNFPTSASGVDGVKQVSTNFLTGMKISRKGGVESAPEIHPVGKRDEVHAGGGDDHDDDADYSDDELGNGVPIGFLGLLSESTKDRVNQQMSEQSEKRRSMMAPSPHRASRGIHFRAGVAKPPPDKSDF
eukprot:TRINITY_DN251_c0_g2_i1.p1 TRINITY_DN251_c0_g2~~TRINITY_DN251_c0_g2_i1.p1  ORF type:complete len:314 (+),score=55.72 TRINITY_DN251_c0_g2_i1:216-1157(+)